MKNILAVRWDPEDESRMQNMNASMEGVISGVKLSTNHTDLYEMKGSELDSSSLDKFFSRLAEDEVDTVICLGSEDAVTMTKRLDEHAKKNGVRAYFLAVPDELQGADEFGDIPEMGENGYFLLGRNAVSLAEMFRTGVVLTCSSDGKYGARRI